MRSARDEAPSTGGSQVRVSITCMGSREVALRHDETLRVFSERAFFCTAATLVSSSGCAAQYSMWNLSRGLRAKVPRSHGRGWS